MKKFIVMVLLSAFAVLPCMAGPVSIENAIKALQTATEKYSYAIIMKNEISSDTRAERCDLYRLIYEDGEVYVLTVIKSGNRYEVKMDFFKKRQSNSLRSIDARNSVLNNMQPILPRNWESLIKAPPKEE
jgi:hypothetical protein